MAIRTSVKSGLWSDPTVWDGNVPVNGDSFNIAVGHDVLMDVDQSRLQGNSQRLMCGVFKWQHEPV